jgi:hypothetical protein
MAANLVGSVALGFGAVLLGTVLARGLEVPAISRAPAGPGGGRGTAVESLIPNRSAGNGPNNQRDGGLEGVPGDRAHDGRMQ